MTTYSLEVDDNGKIVGGGSDTPTLKTPHTIQTILVRLHGQAPDIYAANDGPLRVEYLPDWLIIHCGCNHTAYPARRVAEVMVTAE